MNDTTPEAEQVLMEAFRKMSAQRKWQVMGDLYRWAKILAEAGLRQTKPDATEEEVRQNWLSFALDPESLAAIREFKRAPAD
jgi:hypothetical protein